MGSAPCESWLYDMDPLPQAAGDVAALRVLRYRLMSYIRCTAHPYESACCCCRIRDELVPQYCTDLGLSSSVWRKWRSAGGQQVLLHLSPGGTGVSVAGSLARPPAATHGLARHVHTIFSTPPWALAALGDAVHIREGMTSTMHLVRCLPIPASLTRIRPECRL